MTEYCDIVFKFPAVGVARKLGLEEFMRLNAWVGIRIDTLEIRNTEGYVEGECLKEDWDYVVAFCEATEAVKIVRWTMAERAYEADWEGEE